MLESQRLQWNRLCDWIVSIKNKKALISQNVITNLSESDYELYIQDTD